MMKKIAVVATEKRYADFLCDNTSKYLKNYADFVSYSLDEVNKLNVIDEDFILLSAFSIFQQVIPKTGKKSEIVVLSVALSRKQIECLKKIPAGTRALLVNYDYPACMNTITCMYEAGIRNLKLYPYLGFGEYDSTIKVAITPNEKHLVPSEIEKVYDVGESYVDMNSLYKIADKLGVHEQFAAKEANEARKEYSFINSSIDRLIYMNENMNDTLKAIINLMDEGIIITDNFGKIYLSNLKAHKLLSQKSMILQDFNIDEILPEIDITSTKEKIIKLSNENLIVSSVEIRSQDELAGYVVTLNGFEETEEKQHGRRSKLNEEHQIARYHFEDIVGESAEIKQIIKTAKLTALADSNIVITGESGTGKEIFAQSIHNGSKRKKYNFVAVNCAAIPEKLLESEMFGYEEGSFTGAKKGGRAGLFELAHQGTIFLDEIGEMPLMLQSKLLRVLEEHTVRRVGGNHNICVDVRVICATNKDLYKMVQDGKFREDLFYRINVLPLHIPPLRERKDDIMPAFKIFAKQLNVKLELSQEALNTIVEYEWKGNVRELRNVVEFLASRGKSYIEVEDLPNLNIKTYDSMGKISTDVKTNIIDKFLLNEGRDIELYYKLLELMKSAQAEGQRYGRKKLLENINNDGDSYTEGEVRKGLTKLSEYGFIRAPRGRGGSAINSEGLFLLRKINLLHEEGIW